MVDETPSLHEAVSDHRQLLTPPEHTYPVEPWRLVEKRFSPQFLAQTETWFACANGYLGMRGTPEEGSPVHEPGTYLTGFYETWPIVYGEDAYGYARTGQTMLDVTDGSIIKLYVDDEPFDLAQARIHDYERSLDLRAGTLDRSVTWETPDGRRIRMRSRRFVSYEYRHLAAISYDLTMLDRPANLTISSELVTRRSDAARDDDPRKGRGFSGQVLTPVIQRAEGGRLVLALTTRASGLTMACGADHVVDTDCTTSADASIDGDSGRVVYQIDGEVDRPVRLVKFLAYHHDEAADADELVFRVDGTLDRAHREGFEQLLADQQRRLADLWEAADVEVDGEPEVQQALRFNIFHLHQASARVEGYGIPAKGLTGSGYEGHYFWDTEIYVLPFLVYTDPLAARSLLRLRHRMLDAARERAKEVGLTGALYPWRTIGGPEASANYASGTAQYHIDADIAFAQRKYWEVTGDLEPFFRGAAEMIVETARMWRDLGFFSDRKDGAFVINAVTGPDEYSTVVDNNAYTNLMARENLRNAADGIAFMAEAFPDEHERLVRQVDLQPDEPDEWRRAAEAMYVPRDERTGVVLQDDDFLQREVWDFEGTPAENYPLLLHYHPLVIYRHQVIKQADLVLATFLLSEDFTQDEKRQIFEYYDPLTTGDSSLSASIQSIVATEIGEHEKAYRYFADAVARDLGDRSGNAADGLHIASLGGTWLTVVYGFGGLRDYGATLRFHPRLPDAWDRLRFRLRKQDSVVEVDLRRDEVTYRMIEGDEVVLHHHDEKIELSSGEETTRPTG